MDSGERHRRFWKASIVAYFYFQVGGANQNVKLRQFLFLRTVVHDYYEELLATARA